MEPIIERIKKLLALATSDNVHEAANAAALASKLMLEHKLEVTDLKQAAEVVEEVTFLEMGKNRVTWRSRLMYTLAKNNFCDMIVSSTMRGNETVCSYQIIGRRSDSDAVQYLFSYFVSEIDRLAAEYAVKEVEYMAREEKQLWAPGKSWYVSFRLGAVEEISKRLKEAKDESEKTFRASAELGLAKAGTALMVINGSKAELETYKKKAYPKLLKLRGGRVSNRDAYATGKEAGGTVRLPGGEKGLGAEPRRIGGLK